MLHILVATFATAIRYINVLKIRSKRFPENQINAVEKMQGQKRRKKFPSCRFFPRDCPQRTLNSGKKVIVMFINTYFVVAFENGKPAKVLGHWHRTDYKTRIVGVPERPVDRPHLRKNAVIAGDRNYHYLELPKADAEFVLAKIRLADERRETGEFQKLKID
jgi:hypothetical protein